MIELLSRALELVLQDSHEEGRLLSLYGMVMGQQGGDYLASNEAFDRALAIARREQDVSLELRTLAAASYVDWFHLRPYACIDKSQRVLELGQQIDDPSVQTLDYYGSAYALCEIGNIAEARQHAAACLEAGEKFHDRFWLPGALLRNVIVCMLEGDWTAAREYSDRALAIANLDPRNLGTRVILEYGVGESSRGHEFLQTLLEARRLISSVEEAGAGNGYSAVAISVAARTYNGLEGVIDAQQAARTILSSDIATPVFCQIANAGLGILAVISGDATEARQHYNALISAKGTLISQACMSADRLLGLLAQTVGDREAAVSHFEDSLTFCRNAGYRPELAWSCHDYGETLLERHGPGDRAKADSLLEESLAISDELGMGPLVERTIALQQKLASKLEATPTYPDGLTHREVEVLRLIASGRTDREIAEELFIAVRTVSTHVSNILAKTRAANRTEAARYATRNNLT